MTGSSLGTAGRAKLDAFMERVLAPLPNGEVIDTHFNTLSRRARLKTWAKAEREVKYYKALHTAVTWLPHDQEDFAAFLASQELPKHRECVDRYRAALVKLLLTPAPRKADLRWKKQQEVRYLPVDEHLVAKAIADDEAFLAAHPVRVEKRRDV